LLASTNHKTTLSEIEQAAARTMAKHLLLEMDFR
jgi:hypothetical protein